MFKLERFRNLQLIVSIKAESQAVPLMVLWPMGSSLLYCVSIWNVVYWWSPAHNQVHGHWWCHNAMFSYLRSGQTINHPLWRAELSRITRTIINLTADPFVNKGVFTSPSAPVLATLGLFSRAWVVCSVCSVWSGSGHMIRSGNSNN